MLPVAFEKQISKLENLLALKNPDFPLLKSDFPHLESDFPRTKSDSPKLAFYFLQRLSAFFNGFLTFFNGFPLSPTAFQISPMAFRFSSTAFRFPRNLRKSIYGEKYTKDCYSSFVFFATRFSSFVIPAKQYLRFTQHTPVAHLCSQQCAISKI
jgi:hypothetical protein